MAIVKEKKTEVINRFKTHAKDTGSAPVQIAVLTEQINQLNENEYFGQVLPPSSNDQQSVKPSSKPEPHPDLEKILQEHWDALDAVISIGPVS